MVLQTACSFLGISANFFDADADEARHVTLALKQMKHPHTGEMLADELDATLTGDLRLTKY